MAAKSLFSCRIVDISSYNATPVKDLDVCYSEFRSSAVAKVPVVRIFGSTPTGQKTCLHVHGVFPYIFVPSPVTNPSPSYLQQLASSIDQALQLSLGGNGLKSDQHHVFKISVVKGTPMYGYHEVKDLFLKIYLYNPAMTKKLSELLVAGVVMGTVLQPHEAHIPFVLQMMIDYNLHGMNFIHLSSIKFRSARERVTPERRSRSRSFSSPPLLSPTSPLSSSLVPTPSQQVWDVDGLPGSMIVCVARVSECELEVDALAVDILQHTSVAGEGFPGLAAVWEEERERRTRLGLHDSLTPPPSPDRECSSTELPETTAAFATVVEERLGQSEDDTSPPESPSEIKSCDHQPIRSSDAEGAEPVVDGEAIQQSQELSRRLRIDSLRKSTDEELLDLMLELAQTPVGTATQQTPSQSQRQSVASSLCSRLSRPPSSSSSHPPTVTKPVQPVYQPVERGSLPHNEPPLHSASKSPVLSDADLFDTDFSSSSPLFFSPPPLSHRYIIALADSEERLAHREDIDPSVMLNSSSVAVGNRDRSGTEIGETPEVMSKYDIIPCTQPISSSHRSSPSPNGARTSAPLQDVLKSGNHDDDGEFVPKGVVSVDVQLEYEMPEISFSHFESFQSTVTDILGTPNKMAGTESTTPQKKVDDVLLGVKDRNDGVKNEKEVTIERVKESPFDSSSSLVFSEGSTPLLESSFVTPGNTLAVALSSESSPKESSTPFRTEAGIEREWVQTSEGVKMKKGEGEEEICLSSSQRRVILRQLTCAIGEGGDMSDVEGGERGSEEEEEDEDEEWLSGEWSTQPLTIPESPQDSIVQLDSPIHGLDSSTTNTEDRISQLDGLPDDPKNKKTVSDKTTKSTLSLSLKPNHRKRRRSIKISSISSPPSLSLPLSLSPPNPPVLTQAHLNSPPLAVKWRNNALERQPQLRLQKIFIKSRHVGDSVKVQDGNCEKNESADSSKEVLQEGQERKKTPRNSREEDEIRGGRDLTPEMTDVQSVAMKRKSREREKRSSVETSGETGSQEKTAEDLGRFGSGEDDKTPELAVSVKRKSRERRRRMSTETSSGSGSHDSKRRRHCESGSQEANKTRPKRPSKRRRLGLVRSRRSSNPQKTHSHTQEERLSQNEEKSAADLPHSEPTSSFSLGSRSDNEFSSPCCRDDGHHSDSFLGAIPDPEGSERELSPGNGNETAPEASLSEASSQGMESDFNLMVTESESGEEETVLPIRRPREGTELVVDRHVDVSCHGDVGNHGNRARWDECTLNLSPPVNVPPGTVEQTVYSEQFGPPGVKICPPLKTIRPLRGPPSVSQLMATASHYGVSYTVNPAPFYSRPADTHPPREVNGKLVKIPSKMVNDLSEAEPIVLEDGKEGVKHSATPLSATGLRHWQTVLSMLNDASHLTEVIPSTPPHPPQEPKTTPTPLQSTYGHHYHGNFNPTEKKLILTPLHPPPHPREIKKWINEKIAAKQRKSESESRKSVENDSLLEGQTHQDANQPVNVTLTPMSLKKDTSQLEGPTPQNTCGFKISQSALAKSSDTHEYITAMSVELHIRTRGSLRPDPEWDPVLTLFYYIHHDYPHSNFDRQSAKFFQKDLQGVIAIDIKNCGFQAIHVSRETKKNSSPRKQPNNSPNKKPLVDSNSPITTPDKKMPEKLTSISAVPGGQSSPTTMVARGYLSGCVSGEGVEVTYVSSESELFEQLVSVVRRHDPDILLGYDVTMMSWGYLIDRAAVLNSNLPNQISRTPHQPDQKPNVDRADSGSRTRPKSSSGVQIPGRIVVSVWRLLRKELALTSYSFESTYFQVMHQRIPMFPFQTLTQWYENGTLGKRAEVVDYYMLRCRGNYQMLEKLNVIGRTSEFARLYGIEFENVLTRGSQYRVESMLLRLAKPANYIAVSPSIQQRARMAAPECLPLILEPESKFYSDPVLVLDFQSLYPSIVIGYNYCYTTCLGRMRNLALHGHFTFGTNTLNIPSHVLKKVKDKVTISPNGVVFVDPTVRRGLMPRMLEEILSTRIMVKGSMKKHAADKALNRMLDARQMGLKLIANVTYGYTAANFSGRMPCVEVADSIVGKARETLERAIKLISATREWRARVVYGDTDSVFVLLKGASKDEAFRIGREICDRVTADNPKPIKLKFEKVYYPCILQTKKRYCGYMYETPDQTEPVYDAKGIETVRRDTCPAVAKVLEKSLSLLFSTFDLSQVKSYVQRQLTKLLDGHVSIQDQILAKEYRGRGNYRPSACVPALELARRGVATDPRAEPRPGERVPYVVVYGHPGQPLIQLVRPPLEVAKDPTLRLNGVYYITKQVLPALDRALSLLGVDVYQWYRDLPRVIRAPLPAIQEMGDRKLKGTLGQYFSTVHCPICNELTNEGLCSRCRGNPQLVATVLSRKIHDIESAHHSVTMLCHSCTRTSDPSIPHQCVSLDCPVFYRRLHTHHTLPTFTNLTRHLDHTTLSQSP